MNRDDVEVRRGRLAHELAKRKLLDHPIGDIASDELWACIDAALAPEPVDAGLVEDDLITQADIDAVVSGAVSSIRNWDVAPSEAASQIGQSVGNRLRGLARNKLAALTKETSHD